MTLSSGVAYICNVGIGATDTLEKLNARERQTIQAIGRKMNASSLIRLQSGMLTEFVYQAGADSEGLLLVSESSVTHQWSFSEAFQACYRELPKLTNERLKDVHASLRFRRQNPSTKQMLEDLRTFISSGADLEVLKRVYKSMTHVRK